MKYIYERLKTQRRPNCSALAKALEVSPKTVQHDIDFMRYQLGLPIEYDQTRHGFFFDGAGRPIPHGSHHRSRAYRLVGGPISLGTVCGYAVPEAAGGRFSKTHRRARERDRVKATHQRAPVRNR